MQDILSHLSTLERPRLLISAARHGVADYDRDKHLIRLLGGVNLPTPGAAILRLMDLERLQNDMRLAGGGAYRPAAHVEVLIALMGEARLMRQITTL